MLETAVVIFREGLEAFLIVAIMLAYVTKTGHEHLKKPIYAGIAVAFFVSITTGWHVAELAQEPVWEGTLAMVAGALVASFTLYVMKTAKNIKGDIHNKLEKASSEENTLAEIGVFIFTILMISREGMETALMLGALTAQEEALSMYLGAGAGAALVGAIAYLWVSQSQKINLRLFLQVTGVFLVLFSIELFFYGLHELSEMNAIPMIGDDWNINFHIATEFIETPWISNTITAGLLGIPCGWLGYSYWRNKLAAKPAA